MARSRGSAAGGISRLVALIEQHGEALDADLQHYYPGRRLAEVFTGHMTLREFGVLVRGLPGDGTAMWREGRRNLPKDAKGSPPPDEFWTAERDLLAGIRDDLQLLFWTKTKDAQRGENFPKPIPRPGVRSSDDRRGTPMSIEDFEDFWSRATHAAERVEPHDEPERPQDAEGDAPTGQS